MTHYHKPPRGLSAEEADAWARVVRTVKPMRPQVAGLPESRKAEVPAPPPKAITKRPAPSPGVSPRQVARPSARPTLIEHGLDSHWDRRIAKGSSEPDFTLDLHGHTLESAHRRLNDGLSQAKAMGARMVLVITGKPRPVDAADRGERRGAIRAKILDWLAAGPHESDIAAIRNAHRRHGGEGALYVVMRRGR